MDISSVQRALTLQEKFPHVLGVTNICGLDLSEAVSVNHINPVTRDTTFSSKPHLPTQLTIFTQSQPCAAEMPPSIMTTVIDTPSNPIQEETIRAYDIMGGGDVLKQSAIDLVRGPILSFLQRTRAVERFGPHLPDPAVDRRVREVIQSWELGIAPHKLEIPIKTGVAVGAMSYRHAPFEVQVAVALFCFAVACFDDKVIDAQGRREFLPRHYHNQPQLHVLLDKILESTHALRRLVPSYSANLIFTGLLEYCNEDVFYSDESVVASHDLKKEARNYSEYVRMIDGIPGPFIVAIWPESQFPDVKEYVQVLPYVFCSEPETYYLPVADYNF